MVTGSCLYEKVSYSVGANISDIIHCHCMTCRKAHGSAFSSMVSVPVDQFVISGESNLSSYESFKF